MYSHGCPQVTYIKSGSYEKWENVFADFMIKLQDFTTKKGATANILTVAL
jgi:hypothetical protein